MGKRSGKQNTEPTSDVSPGESTSEACAVEETSSQESSAADSDDDFAGKLVMSTTAELKQHWLDLDDQAKQLEATLAEKHAVEHEIGSRAMQAAAGRKGVVIEIGGRQLQPKKLEKRGGGRYVLVEIGQRNVVEF